MTFSGAFGVGVSDSSFWELNLGSPPSHLQQKQFPSLSMGSGHSGNPSVAHLVLFAGFLCTRASVFPRFQLDLLFF